MGDPLKVFISHKVSEQGPAVAELAKLLRLYVSEDKLKIFISPEITAGSKWSKIVHDNLRESDILILIYTNPSTENDWCLYESGFFAATIGENKNRNRKLICVVPEGADPPPPLENWQKVDISERGITNLLQTIYNAKDAPVNPVLFEAAYTKELEKIVKSIISILGPGEVVRTVTPRIRITLPADSEEVSVIDILYRREIPEGTLIWGETEALRRFNIGEAQGIPFNEFRDEIEFTESLPHFVFILAKTMLDILRGKPEPIPLPPVRVKETGPARLLVPTTLTQKGNGERVIEFVVTDDASRKIPDTKTKFSRASCLLESSMIFRQCVLMKHEKKLKNLLRDKDDSERYIKNRDKAIYKMQHDMNAGILYCLNVGIVSRGYLFDVFEDDPVAEAVVEDLIGADGGKWAIAYARLLEGIQSRDLEEIIEALKLMKDINKTLIVLLTKRLAELAPNLSGELLVVKPEMDTELATNKVRALGQP
jgi:hypothetical protein